MNCLTASAEIFRDDLRKPAGPTVVRTRSGQWVSEHSVLRITNNRKCLQQRQNRHWAHREMESSEWLDQRIDHKNNVQTLQFQPEDTIV